MDECENEVKGSKSSASEETQDAKALWTQETLALELHWLPTAFLFSLKLVGDFNPVLVKLKKFSYPSFRVICKLFDKSGEPAVFHASLDFVINVYHARPPLRKLTGRKSASNKSLLSGVKRIQVADNSTVAFEDLRFIGITAKLKPKWAVLIVQCLNVPEIRPCFIPGVYVKSPSKYVPKYAASLFGSNVKTEDLCLG